jgi:hypothetical protein
VKQTALRGGGDTILPALFFFDRMIWLSEKVLLIWTKTTLVKIKALYLWLLIIFEKYPKIFGCFEFELLKVNAGNIVIKAPIVAYPTCGSKIIIEVKKKLTIKFNYYEENYRNFIVSCYRIIVQQGQRSRE